MGDAIRWYEESITPGSLGTHTEFVYDLTLICAAFAQTLNIGKAIEFYLEKIKGRRQFSYYIRYPEEEALIGAFLYLVQSGQIPTFNFNNSDIDSFARKIEEDIEENPEERLCDDDDLSRIATCLKLAEYIKNLHDRMNEVEQINSRIRANLQAQIEEYKHYPQEETQKDA